MLPQIDNQITNDTKVVELPSKTYKLNTETTHIDISNNLIDSKSDRIIGFVDNLEAIRQAVYHILMTERYAYLIYDNNYGIELEQYIGKDFDYLKATIQTTLKEALLMDLRILDVVVTNIERLSTELVKIEFSVFSIYGDLEMEVNVNV